MALHQTKPYMYTLRKVTAENVNINISLGKSYNFFTKEDSPKEFEKILVHEFDRLYEEITYAFVTGDDGLTHPLYSTQRNYIMTESGKTFENVTCTPQAEKISDYKWPNAETEPLS